MKLIAVLVLAFAAVAAASENFFWNPSYSDEFGTVGRGCCLPTQWEGRVGSFYMRSRFLRPLFRISDSKVGYDMKNKRVGARSLFYCRKTKKVYKSRSVADFNAKKAYFIYKNKCKVYKLKSDMKRPCIPDNFRQFASYTYGAGRNSLRLSPYGLRDNRLEYFISLTKGNCVPVKGAYRIRKGRRTKVTGNYQYYNITTGNSDKGLYNIPSFCDSNQVEESENNNSDMWSLISKYTKSEDTPFSESSELSAANEEPMSHVMTLVNGNGMMLRDDIANGFNSWIRKTWRKRRQFFEW